MAKRLLLATALLTGGCAAAPERSSLGAAIDAVMAAEPELGERLAGSLPPTTLEAARREYGGWNVAVLSWGSGRPGILAADCYAVAGSGAPQLIGRFRNAGTGEVRRIVLDTCSAIETR